MQAPAHNPRRRRLALLITISALLLAISSGSVAWVTAQTGRSIDRYAPPGTNQKTTDQSDSGDPAKRIRQGTLLKDQIGFFGMNGNRITFSKIDLSMDLIGLENLNLERISQAMVDNPQMQWKVSGEVMEFKGENYLLIKTAVQTNETGTN